MYRPEKMKCALVFAQASDALSFLLLIWQILQCDKHENWSRLCLKNTVDFSFKKFLLPVAVALLTSALTAPYILLFDNMLLEAGILLVRCINQQLVAYCK